MNRHKWFSIRLNIPLPQLIKKLKKLEFREGGDFGFLSRDSDYNDRFCFRFFKKTIIQFSVLGTHGDVEYRGVETVVGLSFELFEGNECIWLKIEEPPRSTRDFLDALEAVAGFGFSAEPFIFSIKKQKLALKNFDRVRLIGFRGVGSSIQERLIARVDVASKEGLEPDRLDLLSGLEFKMDQTTYEVSYKMLKGQVTFTSTGLVRTSGPVSSYMIESLERVL